MQLLLSFFIFTYYYSSSISALPSLYTANSYVDFKSPGQAVRLYPTIDNNGALDRVLLMDYVDITFTSIKEVSFATCPPLTVIPIYVKSATLSSTAVTYYETDSVHTKSFQQLSNGATLNFTWTVYNQSTPVPAYPAINYNLLHNNSLKASILLKNWPFQSSLNCLRLALTVRFSEPIQSSTGILGQLISNLLYFLVTLVGVDITLFQSTMSTVWLDDSTLASITFKSKQIKEGGLLTGYTWVGNEYEFWFPSFSSSLLYDPDWSVLYGGGYSCQNNCNNHGTCIGTNNCDCDSGWTGTYCSTAVCPNCNGHGTCQTNVGPGQSPYCACQPGWLGSDCSVPNCPGDPDCSSHGGCDGTVNPPVCHCTSGWGGSDCAIAVCPNGCSSHGTCNSLVSPPTCQCDGGWGGDDCSIYLGSPTTGAPNNAALMYEHGGYGGQVWQIQWDVPDFRVTNLNCNDLVSSVRVPPGYTLTLYENVNYVGTAKTVVGAVDFLSDFNDKASSCKFRQT